MRQKKFDKNVKTLAATDILCIKFFDTWVFLNPRTAPVWLITALWDRIFSKENRVTAHLCIKTVGAPNLLIHWRFPHENFWHCETINSDKTVMPTYSAWKFSVPRTFSKHGRVPLRIFSSLWNKNKSTENLDAVPPSSPSNFFLKTKKLLKRRRDPEWSFSDLWEKKFSKKAWYSVLCNKIFCISFFLKAERFPYQFSRCYQTQKNFRQNCDVTTPSPRSPMHDKFRHQKFFEMQMCSPTRLIVSVKKSSTVNGAILLWCIKISIAKFFWNTERLNGYKTKFIGTMRHK